MTKRKSPENQTNSKLAVQAEDAELDIPGAVPVADRVGKIISQRATYEGPIPHPDIFRQYGEIVPDAPERILTVFEEDSKHARNIQMGALNAQKDDNKRIHWMAWSLVMTGFISSLVFAWMDKDKLAGIVLFTTISAILYSFLRGDKHQQPSDKDTE